MATVLLCLTPWAGTVNGQTAGLGLLDAVRGALQHHPLLRSQNAVIEIARGASVAAGGIFDSTLASSIKQTLTNSPYLNSDPVSGLLSITPLTQTVNETDYALSATRLLHDGITLSAVLQVTRTTNGIEFPGGLDTSSAQVIVNIPLLRGRGSNVVAAKENAARKELRAAQLDLDFLLSQLASNAASDYWNLVAAVKNLSVAVSAEDRGKSYVESTQALIQADHVPANDLNQVNANLAQRSAVRYAAQTSVAVARQQLAFDMGLSADDILRQLRTPADEFPVAPSLAALPDSDEALTRYLANALKQRADYLAAQIRRQEALELLPSAENALLPAVDITVAAGYQGLRAGRAPLDPLASLVQGVRGPGASAGVTYTFPLWNRAALGALAQTRANIRQADVQLQQAARSISQGVSVAVSSVRNAILRVEMTRQAVELSRSSLAGAREKYSLGMGSIVEILQIEDRLNTVLTDRVQAQLDYAQALTQLRFATGTLVTVNQSTPSVRREVFLTLPSIVPEDHARATEGKRP